MRYFAASTAYPWPNKMMLSATFRARQLFLAAFFVIPTSLDAMQRLTNRAAHAVALFFF
jgi:hypothetical protein